MTIPIPIDISQSSPTGDLERSHLVEFEKTKLETYLTKQNPDNPFPIDQQTGKPDLALKNAVLESVANAWWGQTQVAPNAYWDDAAIESATFLFQILGGTIVHNIPLNTRSLFAAASALFLNSDPAAETISGDRFTNRGRITVALKNLGFKVENNGKDNRFDHTVTDTLLPFLG